MLYCLLIIVFLLAFKNTLQVLSLDCLEKWAILEDDLGRMDKVLLFLFPPSCIHKKKALAMTMLLSLCLYLALVSLGKLYLFLVEFQLKRNILMSWLSYKPEIENVVANNITANQRVVWILSINKT